MFDIVRRALSGGPELIGELQRRDLFLRDEAEELRQCLRERKIEPSRVPLGSVQFATRLTNEMPSSPPLPCRAECLNSYIYSP